MRLFVSLPTSHSAVTSGCIWVLVAIEQVPQEKVMKCSDEWKKEREHIIHIMHNSSKTGFWRMTCCRHLKGVLAEKAGTASQSHHGETTSIIIR